MLTLIMPKNAEQKYSKQTSWDKGTGSGVWNGPTKANGPTKQNLLVFWGGLFLFGFFQLA